MYLTTPLPLIPLPPSSGVIDEYQWEGAQLYEAFVHFFEQFSGDWEVGVE